MICEECGCSNDIWRNGCQCMSKVCGCYVYRTGDDEEFWEQFGFIDLTYQD